MTVYFLTIFFVLLFCGIAQNNLLRQEPNGIDNEENNKTANICFFLIAAWLIIVAGHRYNIGTDFGAYFRYYDTFGNSAIKNLKNLSEPGYGLIVLLGKKIHDDGTTILTITSFITIGLSMITIKKNTNYILFATLFFLFLECWHESFNAVRQCLAVAFVFAGYKPLKEGKLIKFTIFIILGFLCHKSAIVMALLYIVARRKVNVKNVIILIVGTLGVLFSYDLLFSFQSDVLDDKIVVYDYITNSVNILRVLANSAPAIFFLIYRPKEQTEETDFYTNMLLIHAAIAIASSNSTYFARMMMYTAPFACISIPELFGRIDEKIKKWAQPLVLVLFCVFWLYDISINSSLSPFKFIWSR